MKTQVQFKRKARSSRYHMVMLSLISVFFAVPGVAQKVSFDPVVSTLTSYPAGASGLTTDGAGNIYAVNDISSQIFKITPAGVTTIFTTVNGLAARGIAIDASGNVYIANTYSHIILKISANGSTVTTFAGSLNNPGSQDGQGAAAGFNLPQGLAFDAAGNLYVADTQNASIRKIDVNGNVTTLAGGAFGYTDASGGAAKFRDPAGLVVDAANNVYVADTGNKCIRKITPAGVVTTFAGDGNQAIGFADGTGLSARFYSPYDIEIDALSGDMYVADRDNSSIRKVTSAGVVTTFAGDALSSGHVDGVLASARFTAPVSLAIDGKGTIYSSGTNSPDADIRRIGLQLFNAFTTTYSVASAYQTFYVTGSSLSANLIAAAPAGYEVSLSPTSGYASSVGVTPTGGTIASTLLYIRLAASTGGGTYTGNITLTSAGAPSKTVSVSGTVNAKTVNVTPDTGLSKVYSSSDPTLTYTATGLVGTDVLSGSLSRTAGENVNNYVINKGSLNGGLNYNIVLYSNPVYFNITRKTVTVTADAGQTKVYGTSDPVLTYTAAPTLIAGNSFSGALDRNAGTNVGQYAITSGSLTVSNNYSMSFVSNNFSITAKPITVTPNAGQTKIYGTANPLLTYTFSPALQNGDAFTGSLSRAPGEDVGNYAITIGTVSTGSANYNVTLNAASFSITPKTLGLSSIAIATKVYDRTTTATTTGNGLNLLGVVTGDDVSLTGAGTQVFTDANAGNNKTVVFSGFSISGAQSGNYILTQPANTTGSITQKSVTITGIATNTKQYDGGVTAIVSGGTLTGVIAPDAVTIAVGTAAYSDKNVGTGKSVTAAGYTLSGAASGNYILASQPSVANGNIAAKPLTITGVTASGKVYDGNTTATLSGGALTGGTFDPITFTAGTGTFISANIGSRAVTAAGYTLAGVGAGNYILSAQPVIANATISAKTIAITGVSISDKIYDATTTATLSGTPAISGVVGAEDVTLNTATVTASFSDKNVGNNKSVSLSGFNLAGTQTGNYTLNLTSGITASITKKALTINGVSASNKTYDGNTAAAIVGGAVLSGSIAGDALTLSPTGRAAQFADKNAGTAKAVSFSGFALIGADANNYSINQPAGTTADITKAPLTVTAASKFKTYGIANPVLTGTYAGFVNGEDINVVNGLPAYSTAATSASIVGTYAISTDVSQMSAGNYSITGVDGTLTINKADQIITFYALIDKGKNDAAFTISATADSGLPVTFVVSPSTLAAIDANNLITLTGAVGTVTVTAKLSGDANHNPAADVPHTFDVNNKTKAAIVLPNFSTTLGAPAFTPDVTSNSTGGYVFLILPGGTGAAIVDANNKIVPTAAGTVNVRVYVNSDATTNSNFIDVIMTVDKLEQAIPALGLSASYNGTNADIVLSANTDANLPIAYTSSDLTIISIINNILHFTGAAGTVTISANQAGDATHNPAPLVTKTICVVPAKPVISANYANPEAPILTSSYATGNQWSLDGAVLTGATQKNYTVKAPGTYTVEVSLGNCTNASDGMAIIITGLEKEITAGLYPNPATTEINFTTSGNGVLGIQILDVLGRPVKQLTYPHGGDVKIDVSEFSTGSYIVKAVQGNQVQNIHFIKK